jgi:hypothetical protein
MTRISGLFALLALAATGCSSYASARLVEDGAADEPLQILGTAQAQEFAKQVQVKLPSDLVVAEVTQRRRADRDVKTDKRSVQLVGALAKDSKTFSDVGPLFADGAQTLEALRAAAAAQHADLMLVTQMSERVEDRSGALLALNLLVLPCWLVSTTTDDLTLHVRAAVVDVRNGVLYATFEDHREQRVRSPSASRGDAVDEAFDRLYAESLEGLRARVDERLHKLDAAP